MAARRATRSVARQLYLTRSTPFTASLVNRCMLLQSNGRSERSNKHLYPARTFHATSRSRAVRDDSTIDFAYLPSADFEPPEEEVYRVPILPNNFTTTTNAPAEDEAVVMKPEISSMSADAVFAPMADMSDGHAMNIDFHAMADRVAANLKLVKSAPVDEQASLMKQIWNDLVDDMIGDRKRRTK